MERVLFAWVHLSDFHFGHGDASHGWDQKLVLGALRTDPRARRGFGAPTPEALLVTGDIAFSGNQRIRAGKTVGHAYEYAGNWPNEVAGDLGVPRARVFMVPGNHDVQRESMFLEPPLESGTCEDRPAASPRANGLLAGVHAAAAGRAHQDAVCITPSRHLTSRHLTSGIGKSGFVA